MQKIKPLTKKQKSIRVPLGLLIAVGSLFLGAIGIIGIIIGLSIAGNAIFAKTEKQ